MTDIILKMDMTGEGDYQEIANMCLAQFDLNSNALESMRVRGRAVLSSPEMSDVVRRCFFSGETPRLLVVSQGCVLASGKFQITSIEHEGARDGNAVYDLTLASAGELTLLGESHD